MYVLKAVYIYIYICCRRYQTLTNTRGGAVTGNGGDMQNTSSVLVRSAI